jgi:adenylate cyclase
MPSRDRPIPKARGVIRRTERGTRVVVALAGALLAAAVGIAALTRLGEPLVLLSYDLPFIVHRAGGSDTIRIVYLDELNKQSLDRRPQAEILDRLGEAGAKMVVYDLIFDQAFEDPQVDLEFAAAMRRFRGVDDDGNPLAGQSRRHVFLACGRKTFQTTGMAGEQLVPPNDILLDAADDFGLVAVDDQSYMIRKLATGTPDEPSLVWKSAQAAGAGLDETSRMETRWMNYAGPPPDPARPVATSTIPSCPASSLLQGKADPWFFRDKIVLIGGEPGIVGEALGKDLFETPFHRFQIGGKIPFMSGVEVQANAMANLIQRNWLVRSSQAFDQRIIIGVGILVGILLSVLRPAAGFLTASMLILLAAAVGILGVHFHSFWFPWSVIAFLQVPVALVWGVASHSYIERFFRIRLTEDQEAIRQAFSKYLSPQMLDRLTAEGFATDLGGEKVEAAMMFTDLENFTHMCERVQDPQKIVETMNTYFERTTSGIFEDDGVVIKFIGDAIFAAWGAPLPEPDAAGKAVRAAWKLFENDKLVVDGEEMRTRIGIHFGEVVAGNIGSTRRVDYTLVGDAVNLASRLEGVNKMLGTYILMSEAVASRLDGSFRTRRVGSFRVKGRSLPVEIHELLGPVLQEAPPDWITAYQAALSQLENHDLDGALAGFAAVDVMREQHGDGPSRFFMERIRSGDILENGMVELKDK